MSDTIKDLKKRTRCKILQLIEKRKNDGLFPQCKSWWKDFCFRNYDLNKKYNEKNRGKNLRRFEKQTKKKY